MNLAELRALAASTGFADPSLAAAVAMAESSGDPHAQGDPERASAPTPNGISTSFGLWQIHVPAHPEYDAQSLLDPSYNARAAYAISRGGVDWSAWSAFTHGRYAQYLPGAAIASPAGLGLFAVAVGLVLWRRARTPVF